MRHRAWTDPYHLSCKAGNENLFELLRQLRSFRREPRQDADPLELVCKRTAMAAHCKVEHDTKTPPEWLAGVLSGREI